MKKLFSILAAFVVASVAAFAQISVNVHSVVSVGESFNVEFTVSDERPSDFKWSAPDGLELVWGPSTGSSISIINGKKSSSYTYTYTLVASAEGEYTIPAATAKAGKKQISSKPVKVKVVKGNAASSQGSAQRGSQAASTSIGPEDLFMRLSLGKRNVVLGEPIKADLKIYKRVGISGFEDVHFPSFTGFWSQETYSASNVEFHRETLGEEIYEVALLRSYELIPQQVGDLVVDPAEIVCLVAVRAPSSSRSVFDSFFESDYKTIRKRISTKQETVHVRPLPEPQPASFCGGVGEYNVSASLTKDSLKAHDAASLVVKVSGKGNMTLLEAPKVKLPLDFDAYDVKVSEKDGVKTFEYPFIPRSSGVFEIEPVEFTYYSISTQGYKTLSTQPLGITVSRNAEAEAAPVVQSFAGAAAREIRDLGTDIRYISTPMPHLRKAGSVFVWSLPFFGVTLLIVALFIALFFAFKGAARKRADVQGARKRGASKMARTRLHKAGEFMHSGLQGAFYEELHRALLGFVSDKLSLDATDLSKEIIAQRLLDAGAAKADVEAFTALLETCEFARYAPSQDGAGMKEHYESALSLISSIDDNMKRSPSSTSKAALLLILLSLGSIGFKASAQSVEDLWTEGVIAYSSGDYAKASSAWTSIADSGKSSPELFYNIGCACFKQHDNAHAVLWFERALKLDPSNKDARVNLEFTRAMLQDRIDTVPEFFLVSWFRSLRHALSSDAWAVLFLIMLALTLACMLAFLLCRSRAARKLGFFAGIVAALIAVFALCCAGVSRSEVLSEDSAIIVAPVSLVRSAPDKNTGTDLFLLHEGAKVRILDTVGNWKNISLSDGRQGWILSSEIEII